MRRIRRAAQAVSDRDNVPLRAGQLVRDLGFGQRQMIETSRVRAYAEGLYGDEPSC